MASLNRVRVVLDGFPGGPGVMTFYCLNAPEFTLAVRAMLFSISDKIPPSVTFRIPSTGDIIESTTGVIIGAWNAPVREAVPGLAAGSYAAPVGWASTWLTDLYLYGRRVRGRTFFVPADGDVFENNGTIATQVVSDLGVVNGIFLGGTAANFVIWQRPSPARAATATRPARLARAGAFALVTSSRVTDKAAVLRSRRD